MTTRRARNVVKAKLVIPKCRVEGKRGFHRVEVPLEFQAKSKKDADEIRWFLSFAPEEGYR